MVLVGMAALVVDGGSWYQADRQLQTAADAAALAGAQHLPTEQTEARTVALDYAQKNYAGIPDADGGLPGRRHDQRVRHGAGAGHLRPHL